jgi:hypothetical protein
MTPVLSTIKPEGVAAATVVSLRFGLSKIPRTQFRLPDSLASALEAAIDARSKITELQAELADLVAGSENDTEKEARLYQIDLIDWQLTRAADLAELRRDHFAKITTQAAIDEEKIRVEHDIVHFFRYYAWGFDPRPDSPLSIVPFELFQFQQRYIEWLNYLVFVRRTSGVVEKARDMGATETALRWAIHNWRFKQGFSAILLSANEDLVDSKKNENTLFEKVRFQLRMLPQWLLPKEFDIIRDLPYMNIANEEKKSALHGYAPTANVGRQSRATAVLLDEFAAWPFGGFPQHTALSATSKSLIALSSVQGKGNKFGDLCNDSVTAKFIMDWREHPWKDNRWYNSLPYGYISPSMDAQQIAQEIDRDFNASQPGKVFTNLREEYCFITWKELADFYARYGYKTEFRDEETGAYRVPTDFEWGRTFDWGGTEGHKWGYSTMHRPHERMPLNDSVFVFIARPLPKTGATEGEFVDFIEKWEAEIGIRNPENLKEFVTEPQYSECSHEQDDLRDTLLLNYGESWTAWDTDYISGLSQIREWFSLTDQDKPNPIRPKLMGRARIYFVAPDDEYLCAFNDKDEKWFVTPSKSEAGFKLLRDEFSSYHYPPEERFKPLPAQRPKKIKDDVIDTIRGHATHLGPVEKSLTAYEKYQRRLKAMLPPGVFLVDQKNDGAVTAVDMNPKPTFAPDITLAMTELRLKREMEKAGEALPFDDPPEYGDISDGW